MCRIATFFWLITGKVRHAIICFGCLRPRGNDCSAHTVTLHRAHWNKYHMRLRRFQVTATGGDRATLLLLVRVWRPCRASDTSNCRDFRHDGGDKSFFFHLFTFFRGELKGHVSWTNLTGDIINSRLFRGLSSVSTDEMF